MESYAGALSIHNTENVEGSSILKCRIGSVRLQRIVGEIIDGRANYVVILQVLDSTVELKQCCRDIVACMQDKDKTIVFPRVRQDKTLVPHAPGKISLSVPCTRGNINLRFPTAQAI